MRIAATLVLVSLGVSTASADPRHDGGTTVRLHTMFGGRGDILGIGYALAVGHRIGRLQLDGEAALHDFNRRSTSLGYGLRLSALASLDALRFHAEDRLLAIRIEGGLSKARDYWHAPSTPDAGELQAQLGLCLELAGSHGGWSIGARHAFGLRDRDDPACARCRSAQPVAPSALRAIVFQTGWSVIW